MSKITTHVLDTALGAPGRAIKVNLQQRQADGRWEELDRKSTDQDGRVKDFKHATLVQGLYRLNFEVAEYFAAQKRETFYQTVQIEFQIKDPKQHYHVPLLISPFSYSTYRGS